mmetsp:Transcript_244/g.814  ORF Transcript_244/g.814 Transcript_244/m.814 type:complete len:397 (+) Transcript_244:2432-3622(+)
MGGRRRCTKALSTARAHSAEYTHDSVGSARRDVVPGALGCHKQKRLELVRVVHQPLTCIGLAPLNNDGHAGCPAHRAHALRTVSMPVTTVKPKVTAQLRHSKAALGNHVDHTVGRGANGTQAGRRHAITTPQGVHSLHAPRRHVATVLHIRTDWEDHAATADDLVQPGSPGGDACWGGQRIGRRGTWCENPRKTAPTRSVQKAVVQLDLANVRQELLRDDWTRQHVPKPHQQLKHARQHRRRRPIRPTRRVGKKRVEEDRFGGSGVRQGRCRQGKLCVEKAEGRSARITFRVVRTSKDNGLRPVHVPQPGKADCGTSGRVQQQEHHKEGKAHSDRLGARCGDARTGAPERATQTPRASHRLSNTVALRMSFHIHPPTAALPRPLDMPRDTHPQHRV